MTTDLCSKCSNKDSILCTICGIAKDGAREHFKQRPNTNADRIRAMTDEELDKFLGEVQWDVANYCGGVTQKQEYPVPEQRGAWLAWLKKEVRE